MGTAREDLRVLPALHADQSARTKAIPANCADAISIGTRWRPYRAECTGSLPTSEVKRRRPRLVLGWGTAREDLRVLPALHTHPSAKKKANTASCAEVISIGTRWRPHCVECTGSLPTSKVKRRKARLVLGRGTAREYPRALLAFRTAIQTERRPNAKTGAKTTNREQPETQQDHANRPNNTAQFIERCRCA